MQYTRSKKIDRGLLIERAISQGQLTPEGADWLTLRLDPYHDLNKPVSGYPDADSYDTVVSAYNYELNVTKPAGAAGDWDAHIFTLPTASYAALNGTTGATYNFVAGTQAYNLGLVNIAKDDSGNPLFVDANPVVSANFSCARVAAFTEVEAGMSRMIGMGIEIIDTTAEVYKQGALTAYRMPAQSSENQNMGWLNNAGTHQAQANVRSLVSPPSTVSEAVAYRGTVQWHAKEGAYMSVGQNGVENPFTASITQGVYISSDGIVSNSQGLCSSLTAQTALQAPPLLTASTASHTKTLNVTQSGIFLTGLANSSTFKIRVRVYMERAPQRGDTTLIPLATPSAHYDPAALEVYSKLVTELPVCVPVDFNAKGDWWKWVLNVMSKILPVAGAALTPLFPAAGPLGAALGTAAAAAPKPSQMTNSNQAKKKKNNPRAIVKRS
jgi:hypothetical protein